MTWILLALAGGVGAAARFLVDSAVARHSRGAVPRGTIVVNTSACLLIGVLAGRLADSGTAAYAVLGVGFLGGYSTFSTASLEAARLLLDDRRRAAALHALVMLALGLAAAWLGVWLGTLLA